jgi:hypothetical protein
MDKPITNLVILAIYLIYPIFEKSSLDLQKTKNGINKY